MGGLLFSLQFLEAIFPKRHQSMSFASRLSFHLIIALLNTLLVRALVFVPFLYWTVYLEQQGWGISRLLGLKGWIEILCSFVVLDSLIVFGTDVTTELNFYGVFIRRIIQILK